MDLFMGIIVIAILAALALYLVFWFPHTVRGWIGLIKKKTAIRHHLSPESQQVLNTMDPQALETLLSYMSGFNRKMSTHRDIVTPSFLKEAYFPETHTFDPDVSVDTMIQYFDKDYRNRSGIKSFFFDSTQVLPDGNIAVGVSRLYHTGDTSRIRYILSKDRITSKWYMDHIARNYTGEIVDQSESSRGTCLYTVELSEDTYLYYDSLHPVPNIQAGDSVYVEGFLVTHEELDGYVYYHLLQMHQLQFSG